MKAAVLQRCTNCGHTADFRPSYVCPSCGETLTPIEGEVPMSIPLCSINAGYNHVWRFISPMLTGPISGGVNGLWQCGQCHMIEVGRMTTSEETKAIIAGHKVIVESREPPR